MLRKIPFDTSAPVLDRFALTQEGAGDVSGEMSPETALAALHKAGHFVDLVNFLGFGLPPREGVCWAMAVHCDLRPTVPEADADARELVGRWVKDPQEATRISLMEGADTREADDPVSWLCKAVVWNGSGSIGPVDGPVVLPPAGLHASALLGAVALLGGDNDDSLAAALDVAYTRGLEVAQGGWPLVAA
ncbi:MAG: hypothetical protein AAGA05_00700 [Pseudomonadota bacterium]